MTETAHLIARRTSYDVVAEQYSELFRTALDDAPLDRALLGGFAEMVRRDHPNPQLLEVGSGPGNVAAHLYQLGLTVLPRDVPGEPLSSGSQPRRAGRSAVGWRVR